MDHGGFNCRRWFQGIRTRTIECRMGLYGRQEGEDTMEKIGGTAPLLALVIGSTESIFAVLPTVDSTDYFDLI